MAYSSIQKKKCKCSTDCDKWPTMSCFGYFYAHLPEDLKEKAGTRRKVQIKNKNKRVALSRKLHEVQREISVDEKELQLWFSLNMNTKEMVCENCGEDLRGYNTKDWYGSQHHIVDKALCPSVATHPDNHLVLGKWCCHSQWHSSFYNSSKMPCFSKAKAKFQLFKNQIAAWEIRKINPYLLYS